MKKLIFMEKLKKIFSIVIIISLLFVDANFTTADASTIGSGNLNSAGTIVWDLSSAGVLTISGSGTPKTYSSKADLPWNGLRDKIKKVQINTDTKGVRNMAFWFSGCKNLTYINRFPDNVENIKYAFKNCVSLERVPEIPFAVTNMKAAFDGCSSLRCFPEFEVLGVSNFSYTFRNCSSLEFAFVSLSYPVTSVKSMFCGCSKLNCIVLFNGCIQLKQNECADLFTNAATETGCMINIFSHDYTEEGVNNLLNVTYDKAVYRGEIKDSKSGYGVSDDGKSGFAYSENTGYMCIMGKGKPDISGLLAKCDKQKNVTHLNIGSGITQISDNAFSGWSSLKYVEFPETLKEFGTGSFRDCTGICEVSLPALTETIGDEAFYGCSNIRKMYIPGSVTYMGKDVFKDTSSYFYLECTRDNIYAQTYAAENSLGCKYPKSISVSYAGNVVEGCRLDEEKFESIRLVYSDDTYVDIPAENIRIDEYKIVAGDNTLTAHYGDFLTYFNVIGTEKSIVSLTASYDSDYGACVEDGEIDTGALSVVAEYDNGSKNILKYGGITGEDGTITESGYYTIDRYALVISGDGERNPVTIRAAVTSNSAVTRTAVIKIPAVKKSIVGITALYAGGNIIEGTGINTDNILAYITFDNGTKERILFGGEYNKYGLTFNTNYLIRDETVKHEEQLKISDEYKYSVDAYEIKKGANTITIWCNGKTTSFDVIGVEKSHTGITAVYNGEVIEDADINMDNLDVYTTYDNGSTEKMEDKTQVKPAEGYVIGRGDNYIDIIYTDIYTSKEYRCSVYIKGIGKTPVEITKVIPVRNDIVEGEKNSEIEYNITVLYDNGKEYDTVTKCDIDGYVTAGKNSVIINYENMQYNAEFEAEQFCPEIVTSIGEDVPETLEKGQDIMLAVTSNSQSALEGKEIYWKSSDTDIVKVSQTGMASAVNYGEADICATVNGRTAIYHVEVPIPGIAGIEAQYNKTVLEDTQLDVRDMTIYLILENNDTIELTDTSGIEFEDEYQISAGKNEVMVFYIDEDTAIRYECVMDVEGIEKTPVEILSIVPEREDIIEGEPLHTLKFKAEILYDNEKSYEEIISYSGKGFVQEGLNNITIKYKDVEGDVEFNAGKFVPQIILDNGNSVPEYIVYGEKIKLKVSSNSDAAMENKAVEWRSSDENVLKVDKDGNLSIVDGGTADITVYVNNRTTKVSLKVMITAEDLKLSEDNMTMSAGTTRKVKYSIVPEKSNEKIAWTSQNTDIAMVSDDGTIMAKNIGTCTITAKTEFGIVREINLTVKKEATKINLNYTKLYIIKGKKIKLKYTIPDESHTDGVVWKSSNRNIANVSKTGRVVAKKVGNTTITVSTAGGKKAKCRVYVRKSPSRVELNKKSVKIKKGKSVKLRYMLPKNSYVSKVTWSTSNSSIAVVSSDGKVKAKKKGTVIVKVKTGNGKTAKCRVTVV